MGILQFLFGRQLFLGPLKWRSHPARKERPQFKPRDRLHAPRECAFFHTIEENTNLHHLSPAVEKILGETVRPLRACGGRRGGSGRLIILYGRRRIEKTRLIIEFVKGIRGILSPRIYLPEKSKSHYYSTLNTIFYP